MTLKLDALAAGCGALMLVAFSAPPLAQDLPPASNDYENPFAFNGTFDHVVVDLTPGADAASAESRAAADEARAKHATIFE